eukprot:690610-Prymnesium_polylepis.1
MGGISYAMEGQALQPTLHPSGGSQTTPCRKLATCLLLDPPQSGIRALQHRIDHQMQPPQRLAQQPTPPRPRRQCSLKRMRTRPRQNEDLDRVDDHKRLYTSEDDAGHQHRTPLFVLLTGSMQCFLIGF